MSLLSCSENEFPLLPWFLYTGSTVNKQEADHLHFMLKKRCFLPHQTTQFVPSTQLKVSALYWLHSSSSRADQQLWEDKVTQDFKGKEEDTKKKPQKVTTLIFSFYTSRKGHLKPDLFLFSILNNNSMQKIGWRRAPLPPKSKHESHKEKEKGGWWGREKNGKEKTESCTQWGLKMRNYLNIKNVL